MNGGVAGSSALYLSEIAFPAHTDAFARVVVDDARCLTSVEVRGTCDELGDVERAETVLVEGAGVALRQHEGGEVGAGEEPCPDCTGGNRGAGAAWPSRH